MSKLTKLSAGIFCALALMACGQIDKQASQTTELHDHFQSSHCEIFVDKIELMRGSHGSKSVTVYLKSLTDRLDGNINGIGFHRQGNIDFHYDYPSQHYPWQGVQAVSYHGAQDYYTFTISIGSDYTTLDWEGAFYVRTDKETTYWLKPSPSTNYIFNRDFFRWAWELDDDPYGYGKRYQTQSVEALRHFNPSRCF